MAAFFKMAAKINKGFIILKSDCHVWFKVDLKYQIMCENMYNRCQENNIKKQEKKSKMAGISKMAAK